MADDCQSTTNNDGAKTEADDVSGTVISKLSRLLSAKYFIWAKKLCVDQSYIDELVQCGTAGLYCTHGQQLKADMGPNVALALKTENYSTFRHSVISACHLGRFPVLDESNILTTLVELMLSVGAKENDVTDYSHFEDAFERLVRRFPPNGSDMHPNYLTFLEEPLDPIRLTGVVSSENPMASKMLFETLLRLLDETLEMSPTALVDIDEMGEEIPMNNIVLVNSFEGLPRSARLERLMAVLRLLVHVLEVDLTMWVLHHSTDTTLTMGDVPLTAVLFCFPLETPDQRYTVVVELLFKVFVKATVQSLPKHYLQILERFIVLAIATSNNADFESSLDGIRYPYVGKPTKDLIRAFYDVYHNQVFTLSVEELFNTSLMLRLPYFRYQFIDMFLQDHKLVGCRALSPQKICEEVKRNRWTDKAEGAEMWRALRLELLLIALRDYCVWHATDDCMQQIVHQAPLKLFQIPNTSKHFDVTLGSGLPLELEYIESVIERTVETKYMNEIMAKPMVDVHLCNVRVDRETLIKYRDDSKYLVLTYEHLMRKVMRHPYVDYNDWLELLEPMAVGEQDSSQTSIPNLTPTHTPTHSPPPAPPTTPTTTSPTPSDTQPL